MNERQNSKNHSFDDVFVIYFFLMLWYYNELVNESIGRLGWEW
jgi:hypothetical protein